VDGGCARGSDHVAGGGPEAPSDGGVLAEEGVAGEEASSVKLDDDSPRGWAHCRRVELRCLWATATVGIDGGGRLIGAKGEHGSGRATAKA
jgi:hypothetical protein